jgi:hypothetical protein
VILNLAAEHVVTNRIRESRSSAPWQQAHTGRIADGFGVVVPKSSAPYLSRG